MPQNVLGNVFDLKYVKFLSARVANRPNHCDKNLGHDTSLRALFHF